MKFAPLRRFFYELHLWLGLVSGLILFVVCLSGSLYVFREEVRRLAAPEFFYVEASQTQRLSADEIVAKVEAAKPGKKVGSLTIPESPTRTVAVVLNDAASKNGRGQGAGRGEGQGKRQGPRDGSGRGQGRGEGQGLRDGSGIDKAPHNVGQAAGRGNGQGGGKGGQGGGGRRRGETVYVDPYTGEIVGEGKTSVDDFFGFLGRVDTNV